MATIVRRIAVGALVLVLVLVLVLACGVVALGVWTRPAGSERIPAGMKRNESVYVPMRDGVRIAVDVWYPPTLTRGERAPTLFKATRYVRAVQPAWLGRTLGALRRFPLDTMEIGALNRAGYVVVLVDARGSGASFGVRPVEWSHDEVRDYGELAEWAAKQAWSNGRVGAWGVSYDGNTAEMFATTGSSAVRAVAPLYDDFDPALNLVMPGGVLTAGFMKDWGAVTAAMDANDFCRVTGVSGAKCVMQRWVLKGTKPVDADSHGTLLDSAVASHRPNYDVYKEISTLGFPRDTLPSAKETLSAFSPFAHAAELERGGAQMLVRVGWLDAGTANVALGRFFSVGAPQRLEIGPWSHGGGHHTDPFLPERTPTVPSRDEQFRQMIRFFDGTLKGASSAPLTREIRYYVMNKGEWRTTTVWPPAEMKGTRWYFANAQRLTTSNEPGVGEDRYTVDTTVTTGQRTRWHTQLGGNDVVYADRAATDKQLLTYTSDPLASDIEITGVPVVSLQVASTHDDQSFHVYLEDVAPDGRVTYVTEGIFRAINRRVSTAVPPYRVFGPYHTYAKADAMPLVPGEFATLGFELFATSVRLEKGHRVRIALAGADRSMFAPIPAHATPTWRVQHGGAEGSYVELPMVAR